MRNKLVAFCIILLIHGISMKLQAQSTAKAYQETPARVNDLVHTKLEVSFDYPNKHLHGKEWLTLRAHFYPTDSLQLDAKGMAIHKVALFRNARLTPLRYTYDSSTLRIQLDQTYKRDENYTVYIDYTAKPEELKGRRKNEKGLYFINTQHLDSSKPVQIWTEGEPENTSVWVPTIDKPNQKSTQEFIITVPVKSRTLSNGKLLHQKINADHTRTDTWQMNRPNAPYLFMMAVGEFTVYKDAWRGKEVSYYLEPRFAPYAKEIFGETPEAIDYFSRVLGVDYPWNKYAQIVVRDYVSGAMENTTATMMGEPMQGTPKELADRYYQTGIAHELFHQWFGDYVTAESWANLTLNESCAVFGELMWLEHKYGKDVADAHNFEGLQGYLSNEDARSKTLVRSFYKEPQEVFDGVTYQKGGSILNMLRTYLGNEAFCKGLNYYLRQNAFRSAEASQLRLALEESSGLDLNWFFNQWYYGAGHPDLKISYSWDDDTKKQTVFLQQTQTGQAFILPMAIDFYLDGKKERRNVCMTAKADTLTYAFLQRPKLVNVDADKILVAKKTDEKPLTDFLFQYFRAPLFVDRYEALDAAIANQDKPEGQKIILAALKDNYFGLRIKAIAALNMSNPELANTAITLLKELALKDENTLVKAAAISLLGKLARAEYLPIFKEALQTQSYAVQGASLLAIAGVDSSCALKLARQFEADSKHEVANAILFIYTTYGNNEQWPYVYKLFMSLAPPKRFNLIKEFSQLTKRVLDPSFAMQGIEAVKELGIKGKKFGVAQTVIDLLQEIRTHRMMLDDNRSAEAVIRAVSEIESAK